jgi:molecular chaperone GrpE (heat shock protein)
MNNQIEPKLVKWPFLVGDAVLLGLACAIYSQGELPMGSWEILSCVVAVALGALLGVTPFLLEHRAAVRLTEVGALTSTVAQIQNLDVIANQISSATAQWLGVQEQSTKTLGAAKEITDRMEAEARAFSEFIQKANTSEKATLRLEIEKLRRTEADSLQVLTRILDHVYALHQAAFRSGQPGLIEQMGQFQNACHDASRRIGLIPFLAAPGKPFDANNHRLVEEHSKATGDARVSETIASGYTYQGQLIRAALVSIQSSEPESQIAAETASDLTERGSKKTSAAAAPKKMHDGRPVEDLVPTDENGELMMTAKQPPLL